MTKKTLLSLGAAAAALTACAAPVRLQIKETYMVNDLEVPFYWLVDADAATGEATLVGVTRNTIPDEAFGLPASVAWGVVVGGETNVCSAIVKAIAPGALTNQQALTTVEIPSCIERIGERAFADCSSLRSVTISEGVRYIGERAFMNTDVTELAIPSTLLDMGGNIGAGAIFNGSISIGDSSHFCYSDDGVLYNRDMTRLYACPTRAEGTINIPPTVTNICADAFFGCNRLSYLNIPASVSVIGSQAFNVSGIWSELDAPEASARLTSVFYQGEPPAAADDIYTGAPASLVSYAFTPGWGGNWKGRPVTEISEDDPPTLTAVVEGLTWHYRIIDGYAEIYNDGLAAVSPASTSGIEYYADPADPASARAKAVRVPEAINGYAVTRIGDHAFDGCRGITVIGIPETVTSIGEAAFAGCTALRAAGPYDRTPFGLADGVVELPSGLEKLGRAPFSGTKIASLELPVTISEIDGNPFLGCAYLSSVTINGSNPKFTVDGCALYDRKRTALIGLAANADTVELVAPASVVRIGESALEGCANLESVTLGEDVATLGPRAFAGCPNLRVVSFAGPVPEAADDIYADSDKVVSCALDGAPGWTAGTWKDRPVIAEGDEIWDYEVTDGEVVITGVDDVSGVVTLPASLQGLPVTGIAPDAFNGTSGITAFAVEDGSPAFSVKNGVLYSRDGRTLLRVPDAFKLPGVRKDTVSETSVTVTIVPNVNEDGTDGTTYTTNTVSSAPVVTVRETPLAGTLPYATILGGVSRIEDYAFRGCGPVTSPGSVTVTNVTGGTTGFIGDSVYVKTTSSIVTTDSVYRFPAAVPDGVVYGELAFAGSVVTSVGNVTPGGDPSSGGGTGGSSDADPEALEAKTSYTGWLTRDGTIVGTVSAKTGKLVRGKLKFSATRQVLGDRKKSVRAQEDVAPDGCALTLVPLDAKCAAFAALKGRVVCLALGTVDDGGLALLDGATTLSVAFSAKGKAKVSGYLADGTRLSASAQAAVRGDRILLPVLLPAYAGKKGGFALLVDVTDPARPKVVSLSGLTAIADRVPVRARLGVLCTGTPAAAGFKPDTPTLDSPLPEGWSVAEPMKWTARYTAKSGLVKGSFYVLRADGRRIRASVFGVTVDGKARCTGVIRKTASVGISAD